jgi:hypothetical protein
MKARWTRTGNVLTSDRGSAPNLAIIGHSHVVGWRIQIWSDDGVHGKWDVFPFTMPTIEAARAVAEKAVKTRWDVEIES